MAHVCILSTVHDALDNRIFYREALSLQHAGHHVTLVTVHPREEVKDGVRIVPLPRSVAVGLAERLWLVSQSASIMIFPVISAEANEEKRKEFTPIISRSVLLITGLGATALYVLSQSLVLLLYPESYLPTAQLLRILLPGIVFLSVSRILANDIAGRGKPLLNTYVGGAALAIQVSLNLALIPRFGATGSAWATTISYGLVLILRLWVYARISGNPAVRVILPQRSDVALYRQMIQMGWRWTKGQVTRV